MYAAQYGRPLTVHALLRHGSEPHSSREGAEFTHELQAFEDDLRTTRCGAGLRAAGRRRGPGAPAQVRAAGSYAPTCARSGYRSSPCGASATRAAPSHIRTAQRSSGASSRRRRRRDRRRSGRGPRRSSNPPRARNSPTSIWSPPRARPVHGTTKRTKKRELRPSSDSCRRRNHVKH